MKTPQYAPGSVGLLRPAWYQRLLVNRPKGIARRGPARPVRLKVEDAERLDAQRLYVDARPLRMRFAPTFRRGRFAGFEHEYFERGTRVAKFGGIEILLSPRQHVPRRSHRKITARCPGCGEQFRYLYFVGDDGPKCRKCHGLIYKSQARSEFARVRRRMDMATEQHGWEGIRPIPARWMEEFLRRRAMLAWEADQREHAEMARRIDAREEAERATPEGRRKAARRRAGAAWRVFVQSLDSLDLRRKAYTFRRLMRQIDRGAYRDEVHRQQLIRESERLGQYFGDRFPSDVLKIDCYRTLEKARQENVAIYALAISTLGDIANSGDPHHAKQAKRQLDAEAKKLGLPVGTRTPGRLADRIIERRRQMV